MQVTSTANSGSTLTSALSGSTATSKEQFLNLLVTQLKNQDPLDPMKNEEFLTQLAQFSSLESMQNIEAQEENSVNVSAAGLIGRTISAENDDYGSVSGTVESVKVTSTGTKLQVGPLLIPLEDITGVN